MPIKTAVIGLGHLGKFHAEKHYKIKDADLVAVVDVDEELAQQTAKKFKTSAKTDYKEILNDVDAVSIAVPTIFHYEIAKDCLNHGVHVLVEKPIASNVKEAQELVNLANSKGLVLEVGHVQRFHSAMVEARQKIKKPMFLEIHRMSPFPKRSTDIDVVLDLMIHDLDLALGMVDSGIKEIRAHGVPVLTDQVDIANARVEFENGAIANFTASRVSVKQQRKFRVFQKDHYYGIDLLDGKLDHAVRIREDDRWKVDVTRKNFKNTDALQAEIEHFIQSVSENHPEKMVLGARGEDGLRALQAAEKILTQIHTRFETIKDLT